MLIRRWRSLRRFAVGARRREGYSEGACSFAKLFVSAEDLDEGRWAVVRGRRAGLGVCCTVLLGESGFVTSYHFAGG